MPSVDATKGSVSSLFCGKELNLVVFVIYFGSLNCLDWLFGCAWSGVRMLNLSRVTKYACMTFVCLRTFGWAGG